MKKLITLLVGTFLFNCNWQLPTEPKLQKSNTEIVTPIQRNDLSLNIILNNYKIGDKFNYSGKIQNLNNEDIVFNNGEKNCLEYKLFNGNKEVLSKSINDNFIISLKKQGYIETKQINDTLQFSICNANVEYNGKKYNIPYPLTVVQSSISKGFVFTEEGKYNLLINIKYSISDSTYLISFISDFFQVGLNTGIKERLFKNDKK